MKNQQVPLHLIREPNVSSVTIPVQDHLERPS